MTPGTPGWSAFVDAVEELARPRTSRRTPSSCPRRRAQVSAVDLLTLAAGWLIPLRTTSRRRRRSRRRSRNWLGCRRLTTTPVCVWRMDDNHGCDTWDTACGEKRIWLDGTPTDERTEVLRLLREATV